MGGSQEVRSDFRLIAATNRNLEKIANRFRHAQPVFTEIGEGEEDDLRLLFKVRFLEWLSRFAESADSSVSLDLKNLPKNELENLRSLGYIK